MLLGRASVFKRLLLLNRRKKKEGRKRRRPQKKKKIIFGCRSGYYPGALLYLTCVSRHLYRCVCVQTCGIDMCTYRCHVRCMGTVTEQHSYDMLHDMHRQDRVTPWSFDGMLITDVDGQLVCGFRTKSQDPEAFGPKSQDPEAFGPKSQDQDSARNAGGKKKVLARSGVRRVVAKSGTIDSVRVRMN